MAVGNQANMTSLNNTVSILAVQLRNLCSQISNFEEFITTQGTAGLEALGFSSGDASTMVTMVDYMSTIAGCYNGSVQQGGSGGTGAVLFDFDNALSGLWAGQP